MLPSRRLLGCLTCMRGTWLLQDLLVKRFEGHWYPDEPHRGCAYRALISTVSQLDPLLMRAAESTGQRGLCESFMRVFADAGEVNCWVRARAIDATDSLSDCLDLPLHPLCPLASSP